MFDTQTDVATARARGGAGFDISPAAASAIVFVLSLFYLLAFRGYGFQVEDEGTLLFHLDRAARGELPYTGFHTGYTPGYFWIGANAFDLVDRSATALRGLLACVNAASVALLYHVARSGCRTSFGGLAFLAPLAWVSFMPVYPGSFAMFNIPYPAWLATLCWLVLASSLLAWQRSRQLRVIALCGFVAAVAFSIKLNAGAYAAAACVWVLVATTRSDDLWDRAAALAGTLFVALGVWFAFGLRTWGIDAGVHLLPLLAIVGLAIWGVRGRFASDTDVGALRALVVLTASFLPLTLLWAVPTIARLGVDGFASEVLLLGSNAAEIYWRDHPPVELYALVVAVGVIGFAALGRAVGKGLIPFRLAASAVVFGMVAVAVAASSFGLMPEGRAVSVVQQLQNASYWLSPLVHWGALLFVGVRLIGGDASESTARLWVLTVCAVAMYWQLYPRTDFAHVMFAVPLCAALAVWLLDEVLDWWAAGAVDARGRVEVLLARAAVALGLLVALLPVLPVLSAVVASLGSESLTGPGERLAISVEERRSAQLANFGRAVQFLSDHTDPGEPLLTFPALSGLTYAAGLTNPVEHDYWYPERPDHTAEAKMLTELRPAPPRFVATINTGWTFFFGSPPYFADARAWVTDNYRLVRRFGRFDILARNDVMDGEASLGGGLATPPPSSLETEPPAVADLTNRTQRTREWLGTVPSDRALEGPLSTDLATALLQIRGLRDAADLRGAAVLFTGYEADSERLRKESSAAASMMVKRHAATVHRWAGDLRSEDYAVYVAPLIERARNQLTAPDEGMRDLSSLVLEVASEGVR